jgi:hypothetical protein
VRGLSLSLAVAAALLAGRPPSAGSQAAGALPRASAAPAFSGRYRLVLTFGRGCPAEVQVGPQSIIMEVAESAVAAGSEVSGRSASSVETTDDGRFVLLRKGDLLHGPSGAINASLGLRTREGFRVWMQIMADGVASTASGGRARASGTAFGEIDLARPGDPDADTIGYCRALDHRWSLEPH